MTRATTDKKRTVAAATRAPGFQLGEGQARAMILRGAASVFAELGVRAASVEDILKAADVSRRTFYRLYGSKEDVALELYHLGTDILLETCRLAVREETDPLRQFERCMDAHLRNAREFGRLIFVLGGEAQRQESMLHARRMKVHDAIIGLLSSGGQDVRLGKRIDPLLLRMILLSVEAVVRIVLEEGDEGRKVTDAGIERARRVMRRVITSALEGEGPRVAPLPTLE
ncbi:TetR/AcrR family transcriptional regulator [Pendulispora albinea]|uniref:TetR/AcrR family transcriptional regulator n=1 Tax=Pendulispora albinea TaxID=2741071 RepID=A0ABZ2LWU8_9BACT